MGQGSSADLFAQVLQTTLKLRGVKVETSQLAKFLAFVKTVCPWFPSDGTINIETWKKVGDRIQGHFQAHGPNQTPVDAFVLWSLIRDCLVSDSEAEKWRQLHGSDPPSLADLQPPPPSVEHQQSEPPFSKETETEPRGKAENQVLFCDNNDDDFGQREKRRRDRERDRPDLDPQEGDDGDPFAGVVKANEEPPGGLLAALQDIQKGLTAAAAAISSGGGEDRKPSGAFPTAPPPPVPPPVYVPPPVTPPSIPIVTPAMPGPPVQPLRLPPPEASPEIRIADHISPLQLALRTATREGEGIAGFSLQAYPVVEVNTPNGPQRLHEPLPYKQLKELKTACAQYGATAPFTEAVLTTLSAPALPPGDWRNIAKACLSGGDFLLWNSEFAELCSQQAIENRNYNIPITYDMLYGSGQYTEVPQQLHFPPLTYDQIRRIALTAWRKLPKAGIRREELSKIRQGPDEPFQDFVARLLQAAARLVDDPEAGQILVKQLAFENANTACQTAIRPWKGKATLNDMIKLCADIGSGYIQGLSMAAAMKGVPLAAIIQQQQKRNRGGPSSRGHRVAGPPGSCFGCGQMGHLVRHCPQGNSNQNPSGSTQRPLPAEVCPRCKRGKHWASECRSQTNIQGNLLSGNSTGGRPRAPKTIGVAASPSNPFTELPPEVPDWTSPLSTI